MTRIQMHERAIRSTVKRRRSVAGDRGLLAAVMMLHYVNGRSQKQIADDLNIGVATVNRLLAESRWRQLVQFKLKLPPEDHLAGGLRHLFNPEIPNPRIAVAPTGKLQDLEMQHAAAGRLGAERFEGLLSRGITVAFDGGASVARVIECVDSLVDELRIYPVAGGPLLDLATSVPALIGRFLGKYGPGAKLKTCLLPAPMTGRSSGSKSSVLSEEVAKDLQVAENANIFLLGVGAIADRTISKTAEYLLDALKICKADLLRRGVIGVTGYSAFDRDGRSIKSEFDHKVCKVSADAILKAARDPDRSVIAVAWGHEKAQAILGILRGGWANYLVTDYQTAEAILKMK